MLTFSEIIAYALSPLIFGLIGIVALFAGNGLLYRDRNNPKKEFGDYLGCGIVIVGGAIFLLMSGTLIIGSSVTAATITPCNIGMTSQSYLLIADTSENLYEVNPELAMRLHLNQTRDITVLNLAFGSHPRIVDVSGSYCPPGVAAGC
jgi:hypothetical protein